MERTKAEARERGFVRTLDGRRCYIPDINNKLPSRRQAAERQAINAPIQGTAADIMKRAMVRVARTLAREQAGARMLLQVHDELVLEVPDAEVEATSGLLRRVMEGAAHLSVPLVADVGHGRDLGAGALGRPERARSPLAGDDQALAASILSVKLRRAHSNLMENLFRTGRGISPCPTLYS